MRFLYVSMYEQWESRKLIVFRKTFSRFFSDWHILLIRATIEFIFVLWRFFLLWSSILLSKLRQRFSHFLFSTIFETERAIATDTSTTSFSTAATKMREIYRVSTKKIRRTKSTSERLTSYFEHALQTVRLILKTHLWWEFLSRFTQILQILIALRIFNAKEIFLTKVMRKNKRKKTKEREEQSKKSQQREDCLLLLLEERKHEEEIIEIYKRF